MKKRPCPTFRCRLAPWAGLGRGGSALLYAVLLAACGPGDGSSLDARGRPQAVPFVGNLGSTFGVTSFAPAYGEIATVFFEQFCTECHGGANPRKGLDLSEDVAYGELVGIRSVQRPQLNLVEPNSANASYLIVKLEGSADMAGRRMPRGKPARPQEEIDILRAWIDQGAPEN